MTGKVQFNRPSNNFHKPSIREPEYFKMKHYPAQDQKIIKKLKPSLRKQKQLLDGQDV